MSKIYEVKHNGYTMCQKRGKNKAVEALKRELAFNGISADHQSWKNENGIILVQTNDIECYSIEEKERFDMKKSIKKQTPFGVFLKKLREKKGVSLLDVEKYLKIPNAYISQLETGARKKLPEPDRLKKIANYYNVTVEELLQKAGYINSNAIEETLEQRIEKEFLHAINDPQFNKGISSIPKDLSIEIKKFIIQFYNNSIDKKNLALKKVEANNV